MAGWILSAVLLAPLSAAEPPRSDADADIARLKAMLDSSRGEIRLLEEQIRRLRELVDILKTRPDGPDRPPIKENPAKSRRQIIGRISAVSPTGCVQIDHDENSGLRAGDILERVSSGGRIRVIQAGIRRSVAEVIPLSGNDLPAIRDEVRKSD
jgi:hypothetical protein